VVTDERPEWREDHFGYELHRAVAARLPERGEEARRIGLRNLARQRQRPGSKFREGWLDEWARLLEGTDQELAAGMLQLGGRGNDLRQMTPLAGVPTQAERLAALERARQEG
jgi:hypothetical protein